MRAHLFPAAALVAALGLAACSSGGGTPSMPGSPGMATGNARHLQLHLVAKGANHDAACHYSICVTTSHASPAQISWCVYSGSTCPAPGTWTWSATMYTKLGRQTGKFIGVYDPNPGNPTTNTIYEHGRRPIKSSNGRYKWYEYLTVTDGGSTVLNATVGIATDGT